MKSWASIFLLVFLLGACSGSSDATIDVSGLNYTDSAIATFSVNGYEAHGIEKNGGGGAFVCCMVVPRTWRPGMKVKIRWTQDARMPGPWKERLVTVPEYTEQDIGVFVVHFYPDDVVKVLVTMKVIGHPEYPYPRPN